MSVFSERPAWQDDANCKNQGNEHFYLAVGETSAPALRMCSNCTVRDQGLEYGLHDTHGIWGGLTPNQRADERRRRRTLDTDRHGRRGTYKQGCRCAECRQANRTYDDIRNQRYGRAARAAYGGSLPAGSIPFHILERLTGDDPA